MFRLTSTSVLIQNVPTMLFVLFVGPWSDQFGRKFLVCLPLFGQMLHCAVYLVNVYYMTELSADWLLLEALQDLTGGLPCLTLGANGLVADITDTKQRTTREGERNA